MAKSNTLETFLQLISDLAHFTHLNTLETFLQLILGNLNDACCSWKRKYLAHFTHMNTLETFLQLILSNLHDHTAARYGSVSELRDWLVGPIDQSQI
ncbi:hypothetical protein Y032_0105g3690 [Ancylostoma ceylanicum]|uniref:Uncharacterized protein n=1 Tax=Ancylostoma ceylanicum TaxID=53326 RepID=A0A016TGG6_9BILA|nr:hypothetical protein Y032_0105g3690 [Ancylostoma ceylanicum]